MKIKYLLILTINFYCAFMCQSYAQKKEVKFGKLNREAIQQTYPKDSLAEAFYILKKRETYFNHEHPKGWVLYTEVHQRIKILTKEGLDYGTFKVALYRDGKDRETIQKLKGVTYNLEGKKVVTQKLSKKDYFENEVSEHWVEVSIPLPSVKVGSVVEVSYTIVSPYLKVDDVIGQEDIPIKEFYARVRMPKYFEYNRMVKGGFMPSVNDYTQRRMMSITYEGNQVNGALTQATKNTNIAIDEFVNEYRATDIQALKEEPYVDNINNYRYAIVYEWATYRPENGEVKHYSNTWEQVAAKIFESNYFGKQIERANFLDDQTEIIKSTTTNKLERMQLAFDYVKNHMTWNKKYNKYSKGIKQAHKERQGNVADINLMLIALLRKCDLDTNPVLISTRSNGIPLFPTREGFNYVIAAVNYNNKYYFLDATDNHSAPNILPTRALNWTGRLIKENGEVKELDLYPKELSRRNTLLNVSITEEGDVEGQYKCNYTKLEALNFRINNRGRNIEDTKDNIIKTYDFTELDTYEQLNLNELNKPVNENFSFIKEEAVDFVAGDMYINPLLFMRLEENPFKADSRNFPINYSYPFSYRRMINIKIPEGYTIKSLPEPVRLGLADGMGSFTYNLQESNGTISITSTFTMKYSKVPADYYNMLKEFYTQRVAKENEKVVLTKT